MQTELYGADAPTTWAKARTYGIGGSDAAAVLGLNPWCSPYTLWCRKTGLIEPVKQTERMRWGHRLEEAIAAYYAEETKLRVERAGVFFQGGGGHHGLLAQGADGFEVEGRKPGPLPWTFESFTDGALCRHRLRPWQLASVDRLVECPNRGWGVLEIKNVGIRSRDKWKGGVPDYVRAQNLHYQQVLGLDWGAVAVLFGGNDPGFMDVEAREGELDELLATEQAFWLSLEEDKPPAADGSESTRDTLAERYPDPAAGHRVALSDDAIVWDREYMVHKAQEKYHREKKRGFETLIRAEMAESQTATLASGVTWKSTAVAPVPMPEHVRAGYRKYTRTAPKAKR